MVVFIPGIVSDFAGPICRRVSLDLDRLVVQSHHDDGLGSWKQQLRIQTFIPIPVEISHRPAKTRGKPPLEVAFDLGIKGRGAGDPHRVEPQRQGFLFNGLA